jgi:hypothetical protein
MSEEDQSNQTTTSNGGNVSSSALAQATSTPTILAANTLAMPIEPIRTITFSELERLHDDIVRDQQTGRTPDFSLVFAESVRYQIGVMFMVNKVWDGNKSPDGHWLNWSFEKLFRNLFLCFSERVSWWADFVGAHQRTDQQTSVQQCRGLTHK